MASQFEAAARAAKVARILRVVPVGTTREEIEIIAGWLEAMSVEDRNALTGHAGARPPSDLTWAEVVSVARSRRTADEIFSRGNNLKNDGTWWRLVRGKAVV